MTDTGLSDEAFRRVEELPTRLGKLRDRKIAVYGTGANARLVLDACSSVLDIVCVIGREAVPESMRIVCLEEAFVLGAQVVLLAAQITAIEPLYRRIEEACRAHGATIVDLYGNDVGELLVRKADWHIESNEFHQSLEACDVLSVDAELLRSTPPWCVEGEGAVAAHTAYSKARAAGKRLAVITDGLPGTDVVEELLARQSLDLPDAILVGAEKGHGKCGGLFRDLAEKFPGLRILHVGADPTRDALACRVLGIEGFYAPPPGFDLPEMTSPSSWQDVVDACQTEADRALVEFVQDRASRPGLSTAQRCALGAVLPVCAGFACWLLDALARDCFDGVVFAARDGFLLKRVYDAVSRVVAQDSLPPSVYAYVSRKAAFHCVMDDRAVTDYFRAVDYEQSDARFLHDICGVNVTCARHACLLDSWDRAWEHALPQVSELAGVARTNMLAHFAGLGLASSAKYVFVDFRGAGTLQGTLERFVPFDLTGKYAYHSLYEHAQDNLGISGYYEAPTSQLQGLSLFMETLMSSPEPPCIGHEHNGSPIFDAEVRPASDLATLEEVQDVVVDAVRDYFVSSAAQLGIPSPHVAHAIAQLNDIDRPPMLAYDNWHGEPIPPAELGEARNRGHDIEPSGKQPAYPANEHPARPSDHAHLGTSDVGFTAGVFDLFHVGHLNLLEEARRRCGFLRVGVIGDELAYWLKGVRTFVPLEERMRIVGALACVDDVVPITEPRLLSKIEAWWRWEFDVAFSGDDHRGDPAWDREERALERVGARIEWLPYTATTSSTKLRRAIDARAL